MRFPAGTHVPGVCALGMLLGIAACASSTGGRLKDVEKPRLHDAGESDGDGDRAAEGDGGGNGDGDPSGHADASDEGDGKLPGDGDGGSTPEWPATRILSIVAHQDDDLLFMNPDIVHAIRAGRHVQTVYVTAGNQEQGYWQKRELAIRAAYARMAELPDAWSEQTLDVLAQPVTSAELEGAEGRVSLLFLRLDSFGSPGLQQLWDARDRPGVVLGSQDDGVQVTGEQLIALLGALMERFMPERVQVLNSSELYPNYDNEEHVAASRFAIEAYRRQPGPHHYAQYRGYDIYYVTNNSGSYTLVSETEPNLTDADTALKLEIADAYFTLDPHFGACNGGQAWWCKTSDWREYYAQWLSRRYTVEDLAQDFVSSDFGDRDLSNSKSYAATFRLADVNGDGESDACIRRADGLRCALREGDRFLPHVAVSAEFSRARGWDGAAHGDTLAFGDLDGDGNDDVCGRGANGLVCALADERGTHFSQARTWSQDFSDAQNWGTDATYYRSLRLADVNGDGYADTCGRGEAGIVCALNDQHGAFEPLAPWLGPMFSDREGWKASGYGDTIRFGDLDGDGAADVCGRGVAGLVCALADPEAEKFGSPTVWTGEFSDEKSWATRESYFRSIRLGDVDGDGKADACGRSANGLLCASSDGVGQFGAAKLLATQFSDAAGFAASEYGATVQLAEPDDNDNAKTCARGPNGLICTQ